MLIKTLNSSRSIAELMKENHSKDIYVVLQKQVKIR